MFTYLINYAKIINIKKFNVGIWGSCFMDIYKRKFDKFLANLKSLKEEFNNSNSSKRDYRNVIAEKYKLILDDYHFDSRNSDVESHVVIMASLLPEWATSYTKMGYNNRSEIEKTNLCDYENFYHVNKSLQKPENMWEAKLEIRFEYFKDEINLKTNKVKTRHKFLSYDNTLAIYKKHQLQLQQIRNDLQKVNGGGERPL